MTKKSDAYLKLLNAEYNGSKIWEQFDENNTKYPLTASRAFKGSKYDDCCLRLMVVGRAMNGWEENFSLCKSAEDVRDKVLSRSFDFRDVIDRESKEVSVGRKLPYRYIRSKFWKLVQYTLQEYNEANNEWYDENKNLNWNEKIVWSNLYKISPRYANNPDNALIEASIEANIDIIKAEIEEYKPEKILFVTDTWYLKPFDSKNSFADEFNIRGFEGSVVVGEGEYNGAKIVVCKRPDVRGYTNEYIHSMAEQIKGAFKKQF